jgi:uncharacterized protein (TIGR03437 family)
MPQRTEWWLRVASLAMAILMAATAFVRPVIKTVRAAPNVTIQVDASITYQRLEGFGEAEPSALPTLTDPSLRAAAIDNAYRQVGINIGTIGTLLESPGGWAQRQNDNGDPFLINWAGFDASQLDFTKRYLVDLAKPSGFTGYYLGQEGPNVRYGSPWLAAIRQQNYNQFLDEAAEQVIANVTYWKNTYGEEPAYFQLGNEQATGNRASINPDSSGFGSVDVTQQVVDLVKRAGARLRQAGFQKIKFMVGTEETEEASYQMASAILSDPQASPYVGAIGYHTYPYQSGYSSISFILSTSGSGAPDAGRIAIRNQIRDLARQYKMGAWLTENSNGGAGSLSYDTFRARAIHIHDEFLYANASAYFGEFAMWDMASQMGHFGNTDLYSAAGEGNVVLINNGTGQIDIAGIGYAIGHYARWIKPGAWRVDSKSSDPLVEVTAFRDDAAGRMSFVLINNSTAPTTATVTVNAATLSGSLTGEQSTPAAYWATLPAFAPSSATTFTIVLPATSVTSAAGSFVGSGTATPPPTQMSVVSNASYTAPVAPDSIVTMLLPGLAISQGMANAPLPLSLNGVSVTVQDSAGTVQQAPLFFVSANQINLANPPGLAAGSAVFSVLTGEGPLASTTATLATIAPGLYSANGTGVGVAAAQIQRVHPDGTQSFAPVFQCGSVPGSCQSVPVNLQPGQDQVYLWFYGTGIRNRASKSDVVLKIGNTSAQVLYAGPQPETPGLDQINVVAPPVHNSGDWTVTLTVGGIASNPVTLTTQ